jgi:3-methyladenine DNA glycosylase/8-oxoguanine DNA glycosylase
MPRRACFAPVRCRTGRGPRRERPRTRCPRHERRLDAEIAERYGAGRTLVEVSEAWRPYRTWAAVHLRALREQRTGEIAGR